MKIKPIKTLATVITGAFLWASCATNKNLDYIANELKNFNTNVTQTQNQSIPSDSAYIILQQERVTNPTEQLVPAGEALGVLGNTNVANLAYELTADDFKDVCINDPSKEMFPEQILGYSVDKKTTDPKEQFLLSKTYVVSIDEESSLARLLTDSLESNRMIGMHLIKGNLPVKETQIQTSTSTEIDSTKRGNVYLLGGGQFNLDATNITPFLGVGYTGKSGLDISAYILNPEEITLQKTESEETIKTQLPNGKYYASQDFKKIDEELKQYIGGVNLGFKVHSLTPFVGVLATKESERSTLEQASKSNIYTVKNDLFIGEEDVSDKEPIITSSTKFTPEYVVGLRVDVGNRLGIQGSTIINKEGLTGVQAGITYRLGK